MESRHVYGMITALPSTVTVPPIKSCFEKKLFKKGSFYNYIGLLYIYIYIYI
jgi:hypothetical protein